MRLNIQTIPVMLQSAKTCFECGEPITGDLIQEYKINGGYQFICNKCIDDLRYKKCEDCDTWGKDIDYIEGIDRDLCEYCFDNNYGSCSKCEKYFTNDELTYIDREDIKVCEDCLTNYVSCEACQEYLHSDNSFYCEHCDNTFCESCFYDDNHDCSDNHFEEREVNLQWTKGNISKAKKLTVDRFCAVEIEAEEGSRAEVPDNLPADAGVSTDGSLSSQNGIEVQTPPLTGDIAEDMIRECCLALNNAGFTGTKACGLHIHIDCRDIQDNPEKLSNLFNTYYLLEKTLFSLVPKSRQENHYCYKLSKDFKFNYLSGADSIDEIKKRWYQVDTAEEADRKKSYKYDNTRYHSFNLHSVFYRGSLEIRLHSGTTNADKIINWLHINLKIVEWVINHYKEAELWRIVELTPMGQINALCKVMGIDTEVKKYMIDRYREFKGEVL